MKEIVSRKRTRENGSEKRPSPFTLTDTLARKIAEFVNPRHGFWRLRVCIWNAKEPEGYGDEWEDFFMVEVA